MVQIMKYCIALPKCSIYRRYRLKILRRELCFEFGRVPLGVAIATFIACGVFTMGLDWLVTIMIQK